MDKAIGELSGKLKTLSFRINKTEEIINTGDKEALERQHTSIVNISSTVNTLKESIEEKKFAKGETEEQIKDWGIETEAMLAEADQCTRRIVKELKAIELAVQETLVLQEQKLKLEFEKLSTEQKLRQEQEATDIALAQQLGFEKKKMELNLEFQHQSKQAKTGKSDETSFDSSLQFSGMAKMPKLVISKFNGTPQDWVRFWGQFEAQIDKANVAAITKFSYLKELVEMKVRKLIDGLPFTELGYDKAKTLLEKRYGQTSEVVGAYVRNILELPSIQERDVAKIHGFYERLLFNVESLQTLKKLNELDAAVRFTLDKLSVIKHELALIDDKWSEWTFKQFLAALETWTINNPLSAENKRVRRDCMNAFNSNRGDVQVSSRVCAYCESKTHKALNCDKIKEMGERKKILASKRLCFNCTGPKHRAAECKSQTVCRYCQKKHHSSICDQPREQPPEEPPEVRENGMTASQIGKSTVIHPVVVVKVAGYKFRALLDTGASHSYASSTFVKLTKVKPKSFNLRQIAMLMGVTTRKMKVYDVSMEAITGDFQLDISLTEIEKCELLTLDNPNYKQVIDNHPHLRDVHMDDTDEKSSLPVHIILGANDFSRIRTGERLRVGRRGEPVAEVTRFGWTLMSPGAESDLSRVYLSINSTTDYERLCALDVLGLADTPTGDQGEVYEEFKEQLVRSPEGWYETSLPWKGNHSPLPTNYSGSIHRLRSLVHKLRRTNMLSDYDNVIREQLEDGVVEKAPEQVKGREFYIPHRAVVRENAETTKLRVVYDASARATDDAPSLNECLNAGPSLQNKLWSVLTRNRFHPVAVAGDIRKAFLQIRICEAERDALRFHWLVNIHSKEVETLRFTRALFGLAPSPFLLNGVIQQHLESWRDRLPESVSEASKSLYVDDFISGATTVASAKKLKGETTEIFNDAQFKLHKWNSNVTELETNCDDDEQQLGQPTSQGESKLLGLPWNKVNDTLSVTFPTKPAILTKRGILANLAKVYDPLGLISPVTLQGKLIYREACNEKIAWDTPLPEAIVTRWRKWESGLPDSVSTQRSLVTYQEPIDEVQIHAFGDASGQGVSAAVYAVVKQKSGTSQGLLTAKSRLAKQGLTIPRLELVAGHMAVNLAVNVRDALDGFPLASNIQCWLDSTVALHWLNDHGEYRQFVANRVKKMQSHPNTLWRHVPTDENPADLGSRGGSVTEVEMWWKGPQWLADPEIWPINIVTQSNHESTAEMKVQRELFAGAVEGSDDLDQILEKFGLRKAMRICAWISRFKHNSRHPANQTQGPLSTQEISTQELFWIKRAQKQGMSNVKFVEDKAQLNLQLNSDGVWECRGRIQGEYPVYLPDSTLYTAKVVECAHTTTLHGGIGLTMGKVREKLWVPRLRKLVKRILKQCWGCKRFHAVAVNRPPAGLLPKDRTEGDTPFNVIGVDFAGPITYLQTPKKEQKAYVVLYSCSLTRGIFLELLPSLETGEFIKSLKRLIARRGRPSKVYSDNGKTFVAAAKWLAKVCKDEKFNDLLSKYSITWQFNLSRAPWWGGQFERLIGLMKSAFYKTVGQGLLTWDELSEVLLDVEVTLNNRPLTYLEEDIQLPPLTPNSLLFVNANVLPELEPYHLEQKDLKKRAKFLQRSKDAMWRRWTSEYLRALRERHRLKHDDKEVTLSVGDVVIIKSSERNRNCWPLAIVEALIVGRDGRVRGAKLQTGKSCLERAVQHLYPLELSCDRSQPPKPKLLNHDARSFRPRRAAAIEAEAQIKDMAMDEQ